LTTSQINTQTQSRLENVNFPAT